MMRKIICLCMAIFLMCSVPVFAGGSDDVSVTVNGQNLNFDQAPIIQSGRTLVPMRAIFEALGYEVEWDDGDINVYDSEGNLVMWMTINSKILYVCNDDQTVKVTLDVAPQIVGDRTLVPVRAISESIGADVNWNNSSKTVTIALKNETGKTSAKSGKSCTHSSTSEVISIDERQYKQNGSADTHTAIEKVLVYCDNCGELVQTKTKNVTFKHSFVDGFCEDCGYKEPVDSTDAAQTAKYTIGICQLVQHVSLDEATQGFMDALREQLGDAVIFDAQNASGYSNACAVIVNGFVSKNVDLIMANSTIALRAAVEATDTIPVLGTSVTDYGEALEITDFDGTVGGNISGTSDTAPLDRQAAMLVELFPEAKNVGLFYCSIWPRSLFQVNAVRAYLEEYGIESTLYPFSDPNDIAAVATSACKTSDVIYIPSDNTVYSYASIVDSICRPAGVPVIAGEEDICSVCGVATLSISYYEIGYKTGLMAAKILVNGGDVSTMPIEYADKVTKKYNKAIAEDLGVAIPDDYEAIETE